jgi:hypothetical protein
VLGPGGRPSDDRFHLVLRRRLPPGALADHGERNIGFSYGAAGDLCGHRLQLPGPTARRHLATIADLTAPGGKGKYDEKAVRQWVNVPQRSPWTLPEARVHRRPGISNASPVCRSLVGVGGRRRRHSGRGYDADNLTYTGCNGNATNRLERLRLPATRSLAPERRPSILTTASLTRHRRGCHHLLLLSKAPASVRPTIWA